MREDWEIKKLRQVCELVNGRAYSKPELLNSGKYRVLRVGNFFTNDHWYYSDLELEGKKYCDTGDLLYAWSASFGPRIWTGGKVIYHYHIWKVLHDRSQIDQKFLFYFFQWDAEKVKEDQGTGTTMLHVSMSSMNEREIPLPPLPEQQRIVALLDEAFEGLAIAKAKAEQNLQNAHALFESQLESVFTQCGPGWMAKPFEDCVEDVAYTTKIRRKEFLDDGEFPIISQEAKYINGFWNNAADVFKVTRPVVIFGDHTKVLKYIDFDFVLGADGVKILPPKSFLHPKFFFYALRSMSLKSLGYARHYRLLKELQIRHPDTSAQAVITKKLDSLEAETQRLTRLYERKLAALEELKKSLLHQAFNGEL